MSINYDDVILKQLREYMTNRNESIERQQLIITTILSIFKKKRNELAKMIDDILDDDQITFCDIPQIINVICTSLLIIIEINDVKIENKELLRYFVFYVIFKFGANEIKYMNTQDIEKFYDDVFDLMTSKIAKIKCLCG
jgi:hypothetical protein